LHPLSPRRAALVFAALLLLGLVAAPAVLADPPLPTQFTILDAPGAENGTFTSGINNRGQVVGYYVTDRYTASHFFVYDNGSFTIVPNKPDSIYTFPNSINDRGQIVGYYYDTNFNAHGFFYDKGLYATIDHPGPITQLGTRANSINNRGQILGTYIDPDYNTFNFLYHQGVFTDLLNTRGLYPYAMNDRSQIVGGYFAFDESGLHVYGFLSDKDGLTTFSHPDAVNGTVAISINNRGEILGYYFDADYRSHGFVYYKGVYTALPILPTQ
jgi:probable HAF family extracellular repeat protein